MVCSSAGNRNLSIVEELWTRRDPLMMTSKCWKSKIRGNICYHFEVLVCISLLVTAVNYAVLQHRQWMMALPKRTLFCHKQNWEIPEQSLLHTQSMFFPDFCSSPPICLYLRHGIVPLVWIKFACEFSLYSEISFPVCVCVCVWLIQLAFSEL